MGEWTNSLFSENLLEKNFQLAAGPCRLLRPECRPRSRHSNMLSRLDSDVDAANSSASSYWTFISIQPQAHSKRREEMKAERPSRY